MSLKQRIRGAVAILRGIPTEGKLDDSFHIDAIETMSVKEKNSNATDKNTPLDNLQAVVDWISANSLLILTITGVFVGLALGFLGRLADFSSQTIMLISFPGEILMRVLKMFVLPLIISSLIIGMANMDARSSGRMGIRALCYYLVTTILAAIVGIVVVLIIHPGDPRIQNTVTASIVHTLETPKISTLDAMLDIVRNLVPENLVQACFQQVQTTYVKKPVLMVFGGRNQSEYVLEHTLIYRDGTNIMGMIAFCITFGFLVGQLGSNGKVMVDFFSIINEIIMKVLNVVIIWYSPFGIMCLIAGKIMSITDVAIMAKMLGLYMITVILGLLIHGVITLPIIFWLMTRRNPATFFKGMIQAWITAAATASSSAAMPVTFRCLEENNKIDSRVTRFVISIGSTVNMDGTALYEAIAAIFIAQMNGIPLGFGDVLTVSITATLASIGAASIPSSALVTMVLVLSALGLPTNDISLLFTVDWLLDRLRTSVNVLGDSYGAGIVYHLSKDELDKMDNFRKIDCIESGIPDPETHDHFQNVERTSETKI